MIRKLLCNDQWERIEQMLPGKKSDRGQTAADNQLFVEGGAVDSQDGCSVAQLSGRIRELDSVYKRFARWSDAGVWHRVFAELCKDADFEEINIY